VGSRGTAAPIEHRRKSTIRVISAYTVFEDGWAVVLHLDVRLARINRCRLTRTQHLGRLRDPLPVIRDGAPDPMAEPPRSLIPTTE
jgi:hypothetical protein